VSLDLEKLPTFVAVARAGSLVAAARALHVTPSAVSHALSKLQHSAGCRLFEWRGRRFSLTDEGAELYEVARRVLDELEEVDRRLAGNAGSVRQRLVLGATLEFGSAVLVPALRPFLDAHPELDVDVRLSNELQRPLACDEVDLAVDCQPHAHPGVLHTVLFRERYVVVATPQYLARHRLRSPLDLRRVVALSLDREGSWWNRVLRAVPPHRRPELGRIMALDHVRGLVNGALAGYGVALVPKYAVIGDLARGSLQVTFPRLRLLEDTFCIYQKMARAARPANVACTRFLLTLDLRELGDALGPV